MLKSIKIPISKTNETVVIFLDELEDLAVSDLLDILRGELAPLNVWKDCAVEYHRQNQNERFSMILEEIVESLNDEDVKKIYRNSDFEEMMCEIYNVLAAKKFEDSYSQHGSYANEMDQIKSYLENVKKYVPVSEYSWLIEGFIEIKHNNAKRALEKFSGVITRASAKNNLKRKYLFAGHVGSGIAHYTEAKYELALEHFLKGIQSFPSTNATLRVAIAACCYRLGYYERANAAIDSALNLDPSNSNALVMKSILLQIESQKIDRTKRINCRLQAFENCVLASTIDSNCSTAFIQMANHIFHTWKLISDSNDSIFRIVSDFKFMISTNNAVSLTVGNIIRLNGITNTYIVKNVEAAPDGIHSIIEIDKPVLTHISELNSLECRDLNEVVRLVESLISSNSNNKVQSEGYYILGKVRHIQGNIEDALINYLQSLQNSDDMILAAFGAAQIYFSKQDFVKSLQIFERVHQAYPLDKDTQAYICLLKGLCNKEVSSFDVLRDVTPGFPYQAELWLLQGNLRIGDPNQTSQTLKCFLHALECSEENKLPIHPNLLSNIAILNHGIGKFNTSLDFMKRALVEENSLSSSNDELNPEFRSSDLENIFYSWGSPICSLQYVSVDDNFVAQSDIDLTQLISVGDEILLGDALFKVNFVCLNSLKGYCPILIRSNETTTSFELRVKQKWRNFYGNITNCFNMAKILESCGSTSAATEVYIQLLKQHPSFIECYLRLSEMAKDMGNFTEATLWLSKALSVDEHEPDVNISVGDLYNRSVLLEDAKKSYEKVCSKNRHDARAMISLGNFYFGTLNSKDSKYDSHLKDSYKFYYAALSEDVKNIYATNGLGMVCAEKGLLQVSRDIFTRAREESLGADIGINLAHVLIGQKRFADAEHLYISTIKSLIVSCRVDKVVSVHEWTALAQLAYNRLDSSLNSLLKGTHLNPLSFRLWFNVAIVNRDYALFVKSKSNRSISDVESALQSIDIATQFFSFYAKTSISFKREPQYERSVADKLGKNAKEMKYEVRKLYDEMMRQWKKIEEQKRKKEEEHERWRNQKNNLEEENRMKSLDEQNKLKERFSLKQKQLDELNEKWTNSVQDKDNSDPISTVDNEVDAAEEEEEKDVIDDLKDPINEAEVGTEEEQQLQVDVDKDDDGGEEMSNIHPTKKQKIESDLFGDSDDEDDC